MSHEMSAVQVSDSGGPVETGQLLVLDHVSKYFPLRGGLLRRQTGQVHAVDGVSLAVAAGETVGLVGESGSGKTTVGQMVVRLTEPSAGRVVFDGRDITHLSAKELRPVRRQVQFVFQDPSASLDRRMTARAIVGEPLLLHKGMSARARQSRVLELLRIVGLSPGRADQFPHAFSGGQRQRIAIARALASEPRLLVLDEPTSALDVSIQAQVVNLLQELQRELGVAYLFISHDLSVVRHIAQRVAVMYAGKLVELGIQDQLYDSPLHPYTQALLSAVPDPDPRRRSLRERIVLSGDLPNPGRPPSGCRFRTRCWKATDLCAAEEPLLVDRLDTGHPVACHHPGEALRPSTAEGGPTS